MLTDFYKNELNIGDRVIYVPSKPHKSISIGIVNEIHYYKYSPNSDEYYLAAITIDDSSSGKERKIANIKGEQLIKLEYFKEIINKYE